ncbi:MAG: hypothetical protein V1886_01000 [archaeon]
MNREEIKKLNLGDIIQIELSNNSEVVGYLYSISAEDIHLSRHNPRKKLPFIFNFIRGYNLENIKNYKVLKES